MMKTYAKEYWDILIILDKEELLPSDYDNVTYPLTIVGLELWWELLLFLNLQNLFTLQEATRRLSVDTDTDLKFGSV